MWIEDYPMNLNKGCIEIQYQLIQQTVLQDEP